MKRATLRECLSELLQMISIHALVKRATIKGEKSYVDDLYFNPRPREEGDKFKARSIQAVKDFNPRPREEGDQG